MVRHGPGAEEVLYLSIRSRVESDDEEEEGGPWRESDYLTSLAQWLVKGRCEQK